MINKYCKQCTYATFPKHYIFNYCYVVSVIVLSHFIHNSVSEIITFIYRYESDVNSPVLQEESDAGANSSESEYLLSDPTGYKTQTEFSPDKKVQFNDGDAVPSDKEKPHKEKKKKK